MNVSDEVRKLRNAFQLARQDPQYSKMVSEYLVLEQQLGELTRDMTDEEQDVVWGVVCLPDDMNWRMIEIFCEKYGINLMDIDSGQ